jgi:hypothetical protein
VNALEEQAKAIETERAHMERQLCELNAQPNPTAQIALDDILRYCQELSESLRHDEPETRKRIARRLIQEI